MSKAVDILTAIKNGIDSNKSVINTVELYYKPLDDLVRELQDIPGNFPKAIVLFDDEEREVPYGGEQGSRQAIGKQVRYVLPIEVDILSARSDDSLSDVDGAVTEVRDYLDDEANARWTSDNFPVLYPLKSVQRSTLFVTLSENRTVVPFDFASIRFNVLYYFNRGDS